jgi:hypothetical protein
MNPFNIDIIHEIGKRSNYKNYATLLLTSKEYYNAKFLTDLKLRDCISEYPNVDELLFQTILLDDVVCFDLIEELRFGNFTLSQINYIIIDAIKTNAVDIFKNVISRFDIESLNFDRIFIVQRFNIKTSSIIVENLLKCVKQDFDHFFSQVCDIGNTELVKKLLQDQRFDPSCLNNQVLRYACESGQEDIVQLLLEDNRVNPFLPNNNPLLGACRAHNADLIDNYNKIVELLLEHPLVDPNFNNAEAVKLAAKKHNWIIVSTMLKHQRLTLSVDQRNDIFTRAFHQQQIEVIQSLITKHGFDIHWSDNFMLRRTLRNGFVKILEYMVTNNLASLNDIMKTYNLMHYDCKDYIIENMISPYK